MGDNPNVGPRSLPSVLELDHVFDSPSHPHRRYLLYALLEETACSLRDLAAKIAAWEAEGNREPVSDDVTERIYIALYHIQVPKLTADDIVEFDSTTETVRPGANAEQVLAVLEHVGGSTDGQLESHARGEHDEGWT